jgi:hypothetical protein
MEESLRVRHHGDVLSNIGRNALTNKTLNDLRLLTLLRLELDRCHRRLLYIATLRELIIPRLHRILLPASLATNPQRHRPYTALTPTHQVDRDPLPHKPIPPQSQQRRNTFPPLQISTKR